MPPASLGFASLKIAAIFILVASSLSWIWSLVDGLGRSAVAFGMVPMPAFAGTAGVDPAAIKVLFYSFFVLDIVVLLLGPVVILGAVQMLRRKMYGFVRFTAILAMLPLSTHCCCVLGLPMGIWALVILNRPDVKAMFQKAAI